MIRRLPVVLTVAVAAFTAAPSPGQEGIQLPDMGASAGAVVSRQDERAYGEALMREFRRLARTVDDPLVESYVRHLGYDLVSHSEDAEQPFTFFVVDDRSINAFAAPGGFIGVHTGLMLAADNESELAGVLAHEIAHVTQRHIARAIESMQRMSLPMTLLMLGAVLAGASAGGGDAVQGAVVGSQALMRQMQINFTRANEYEADRVGIQKLAAAGYDPNGMASFFGKMARFSRGYGSRIPEFLRTHPVETTRIAEAKDRARQVDVRPRDDLDPMRFLLIRERLRVLSEERPQDLIDYYRTTGSGELWGAYGLALAQLRSGDPVGAAETIQPWRGEGETRLAMALLLAEIDFAAGRGAEAFESLAARYPDSMAVGRGYAEALLDSGLPGAGEKAEALLRPLLPRHADNAELFELYARAADRAGDRVRAIEAYAQFTFLHGRVYDAVTQLRKLLNDADLDYYQRSRIRARLAEIEPILAEIQRTDGWDPSETDREDRG